MKRFLILFFLLTNLISSGQINYHITPEPASIKEKQGLFVFSKETKLSCDATCINAGNYLKAYLDRYFHYKPETDLNTENKLKSIPFIELIHDSLEINPTKYELDISSNKISIKGSAQGVFYGIQTLIQLLPTTKNQKLTINAVAIKDSARFNYRGMHFDVSRHFFSVDFVKKYIDYLALHKFNTLHWHLTDDQGWRIEIKKYPKLTETGSCRDQTLIGPYGTNKYDGKKYCGYYTQDEIKDIVKYASERYITIIPEIEMPGHSMAALSSYPFLGCTKGPYQVMQTWGVSDDVLCAGNDSSFTFLENVMDEIIPLFPSKYIHIGGDECPKERWQTCQLCQKRMTDNNLKNEHELQSYFISRMEKYINNKGKNIIGWDEILEGGLAPNATVMSWRGEEGGVNAAKQKHFAIMTPGTPLYFDHSQSINEDSVTQGGYIPLKMVYEYEPIPAVLSTTEAKFILGAQANMWTEYMDNERKVEYMLFPRIAALSEVLWTPQKQKNWSRFESNLPSIFSRYKLWNINFSKAYFDIQTNFRYIDSSFKYSKNKNSFYWSLSTNNKQSRIKVIFPNDSTKVSATNELNIIPNKTGTYKVELKNYKGEIIGSPVHQKFHINKATGKKIELNNPPNNNYSVGGALTLVNGIQNEKGMSKSSQFLGFWGTDLNATIDLGKIEKIDSIKLHIFEQNASWIYPPKEVRFYESKDGINYEFVYSTQNIEGHANFIVPFIKTTEARFIRIIALNYGEIPPGKPGAGNKAWLFTDEIEVF